MKRRSLLKGAGVFVAGAVVGQIISSFTELSVVQPARDVLFPRKPKILFDIVAPPGRFDKERGLFRTMRRSGDNPMPWTFTVFLWNLGEADAINLQTSFKREPRSNNWLDLNSYQIVLGPTTEMKPYDNFTELFVLPVRSAEPAKVHFYSTFHPPDYDAILADGLTPQISIEISYDGIEKPISNQYEVKIPA